MPSLRIILILHQSLCHGVSLVSAECSAPHVCGGWLQPFPLRSVYRWWAGSRNLRVRERTMFVTWRNTSWCSCITRVSSHWPLLVLIKIEVRKDEFPRCLVKSKTYGWPKGLWLEIWGPTTALCEKKLVKHLVNGTRVEMVVDTTRFSPGPGAKGAIAGS